MTFYSNYLLLFELKLKTFNSMLDECSLAYRIKYFMMSHLLYDPHNMGIEVIIEDYIDLFSKFPPFYDENRKE